jgi:hypothetical protein
MELLYQPEGSFHLWLNKRQVKVLNQQKKKEIKGKLTKTEKQNVFTF